MDRIDQILGIIDDGLREFGSCVRCGGRTEGGPDPGGICPGCRDFLNMRVDRDPAVERRSARRAEMLSYQYPTVTHAHVQRRALFGPLGDLRLEIYGGQPYEQQLFAGDGRRVTALYKLADERGYPAPHATHGYPRAAYGLVPNSCSVAGNVVSYRYTELLVGRRARW